MIPRLLEQLGIANDPRFRGGSHACISPIDGSTLATVRLDDAQSYEQTVARSVAAFARWRMVPAPQRGLVVRAIGDAFREHKDALGRLLAAEVGKILQEGWGEVQETIDIADFAVGLSRQLYGLTMPSERASHRLAETWHPLGPIGVISAFNFPNAVWAWNAMVAAVCGDTIVWKPSTLAPLTAIASNAIAQRVATAMGHPDVFTLVIGTDDAIGERLVADRRLPLISATGSCRMGKRVGSVVAQRLARCLLELGGNNAAIVHADADLALAIPAIVFAAAGTAGQRCTTTRRLIVHRSIADEVCARLVRAYGQLRIGNPLHEGTLVGPLINARAVETYDTTIAQARAQGASVLIGAGKAHVAGCEKGHFVQPTILRAPEPPAGAARAAWYRERYSVAMEEAFAPILHVFTFDDASDAIAINNMVDQGLSSAVFTASMRHAERFLAPDGSDCGIANVNAGTSGAEIGGAFGGEKDTGGGRESGSDSWKAYMRRQTSAINFGEQLALAQGIRFD